MQIIAQRLFRVALTLSLISLSSGLAAEAKVFGSQDAAGLRELGFQQYLRNRGNADEALESYQKAVDLALKQYGSDSSYVGELYYEMGALALDANKTHKAEVYLQKAVQQNPNSIMARIKYSDVLQRRGRPDLALQQIQAALAKHQNAPQAREALVLWMQNNGQSVRAIQESYLLSKSMGQPAPAQPAPAQTQTQTQTVVASAASVQTEKAVAPSQPAGFWASMLHPKPKEEKPPVKAKSVEAKKPEPKKPEPRPEPKARKGARSKPEPVHTVQPIQESKSALVTSAKQLPKATPTKSEVSPAKRTETDDVQAPDQPPPKKESPKKEQPKPVGAPPMQMGGYMVPMGIPVTTPSKPKKGSFVPPPPPLTPIFPGAMPMMQPPQAVPKPVEKPKSKPKAEPAKEAAPEKSSGGNSEDPDFILEWAGKKKK